MTTSSFNLATTSASWRTSGAGRSPPTARRFNLATTSASWRTPLGPPRRDSGRSGVNLATTSASWRTPRPRPPRGDRRGFNLATTSASWRTDREHAAAFAPPALQFGHDVSVVENFAPWGVASAPSKCFNLATTSASWRTWGVVVTATAFSPGFNLATTSASWRTICYEVGVKELVELQFGHDVSVVENGREAAPPGYHVHASIWPRRQRRGEPGRTATRCAGCRRFNLATTSASWRTWRGRDLLRRARLSFNLATTSASWRTGRGRWSASRKPGFNLATTSASWRTDRVVEVGDRLEDASIWPRRQRRGELSQPLALRQGPDASIWPRRQRRGERDPLILSDLEPLPLQFGHDVSVVENLTRGGHLRHDRRASIWPRRQRRGEPRC